MTRKEFLPPDYFILFLMVAALIAIGIYFGQKH